MRVFFTLAAFTLIPALASAQTPVTREDFFAERFGPQITAEVDATPIFARQSIKEFGLDINPNGNYDLRKRGFTEDDAFNLARDLAKYSKNAGLLLLNSAASYCLTVKYTKAEWQEFVKLVHAAAPADSAEKARDNMAKEYAKLHKGTSKHTALVKVCDMTWKNCSPFNQGLREACRSTRKKPRKRSKPSKIMQEELRRKSDPNDTPEPNEVESIY